MYNLVSKLFLSHMSIMDEVDIAVGSGLVYMWSNHCSVCSCSIRSMWGNHTLLKASAFEKALTYLPWQSKPLWGLIVLISCLSLVLQLWQISWYSGFTGVVSLFALVLTVILCSWVTSAEWIYEVISAGGLYNMGPTCSYHHNFSLCSDWSSCSLCRGSHSGWICMQKLCVRRCDNLCSVIVLHGVKINCLPAGPIGN